jgi:hypothetical protein
MAFSWLLVVDERFDFRSSQVGEKDLVQGPLLLAKFL